MEGMGTGNHLDYILIKRLGADGAILAGLGTYWNYAGHEELSLGAESWHVAGWDLGVASMLIGPWCSHGCA